MKNHKFLDKPDCITKILPINYMNHFLRRISALFLYFSPLIVCLVLAVSCRTIEGDGTLKFATFNNEGEYILDSELTITFDTVFTSIGSITRHFTVHNTSNQEITTDIFLVGGKNSFYSINVNGVSGTSFKNITIPKKDSIFIFIKVNIDPKNQNNPFLVTDDIMFITGSNEQHVRLVAYGQDARYIIADQGPDNLRYKVVAGEGETVTWTKDRPYVVYGWAVVDSSGKLIIEPGTRIYFHNNSGLWAYRYSTLEINGTLEEPVLLRGDRLEKWFDEDYAQWHKIWINEGVDANINYAVITNAFIGIHVDPLVTDNSITVTPNVVKIENTIIKNTHSSGVLSRLLNVDMTNCLITNNGGASLQLEGGDYNIKHVTVANFFKAERKNPACYVSNKISDPLFSALPPIDTKADFVNCIIFGRVETEVYVNKDNGAKLEASFQNCLVKAKDHSSNFIDCIRNEDPKFVDVSKLNFQLQPGSPAIGKGKSNVGVLSDILGIPRGDKPDIGAYQSGR